LKCREPSWFGQQAYFNEWLSGFIEAEGCFSARKNQKTYSFSIWQKHDFDILEGIREHFKTVATVRERKSRASNYSLETYNRKTIESVINHCRSYPLLGEKSAQLAIFIKKYHQYTGRKTS
jgi:intein-encoded DNA endonuclease-like protein